MTFWAILIPLWGGLDFVSIDMWISEASCQQVLAKKQKEKEYPGAKCIEKTHGGE